MLSNYPLAYVFKDFFFWYGMAIIPNYNSKAMESLQSYSDAVMLFT